jgi:hypothetical protein
VGVLLTRLRKLGPSRTIRFVAELVLPYKDAEILLDDLDERFPRKRNQYGPIRAHVWYYYQILLSIRPLSWGVVVATWETIRRLAN